MSGTPSTVPSEGSTPGMRPDEPRENEMTTERHTMHDPQKLDRYLLGRLSDLESDALEAELLRDRRLFDLAEAAEDDLVDRYVRGELPPEDRKRFERHLLPSERIRERVAVAQALRDWTDGQRAPRIAAHRTRGPFARTARLAWAAALIAAIGAGALGFEVARLHDRLEDRPARVAASDLRGSEVETPRTHRGAAPEPSEAPASEPPAADPDRERVETLEQELRDAHDRIASLEASPASATDAGAADEALSDRLATATVFLTLATRGVDSEAPIELDAAERVELQLELGRRRPRGDVRAKVTRQHVTVWTEENVEVVSEEGESMATVTLPRQSLNTGRYFVELADAENEDLLGSYSFLVE